MKNYYIASTLIFYVFLLINSLFFNPKYAHSWGAVINETIFSKSVETHQWILNLAWEILNKDKAFDENVKFPLKEAIFQWEGVKLTSSTMVLLYGASSTGGPDADGSGANYSEHYYNPFIKNKNGEIGVGAANLAVEKYFSELLSFNNYSSKNSSNNKIGGGKAAAWSAHFLADMLVPFHTSGIPEDFLVNNYTSILSSDEHGGYIFWNPSKLIKLDESKFLNRDSIDVPNNGWGKDGNFSFAIDSYRNYKDDNTSQDSSIDWFDPWYYNGMTFTPERLISSAELMRSAQIALSSHARWEEWAHEELLKNKNKYNVPGYASDWENAKPSFDRTSVIYNQVLKAKDYTVKTAFETRKRAFNILKNPVSTIYQSASKVASLWRASFSALKPSIEVLPLDDSNQVNKIKIRGNLINVADDIVEDVSMKLTVTGGKIIGSNIVKINSLSKKDEDFAEWIIVPNNTKSYSVKLEAIGTYKTIPDLGYAFIEKEFSINPNQTNSLIKNNINLSKYKNCKISFTINNIPKKGRVQRRKYDCNFKGSFNGNVFKGISKALNTNGVRNESGECTVTLLNVDSCNLKVSNYSVQSKYDSALYTYEYIISGDKHLEIKLNKSSTKLIADVFGVDTSKYISNYKMTIYIKDRVIENETAFNCVDSPNFSNRSSFSITFSE